ncbi:MAG: Crp/Fnr family transcriptional regulator [Paralcaligenes sp.]
MDWQALIETQSALALVPAVLREVAEYREVKAGEMLFRLGVRPRSILYVIGGEVRLLRHARNGDEIILQRSNGGFIAEASIDARAYHCDAVVTAAGAVLCLPIQAFKAALAQDNMFHQAWAAHLAREVRKLRARCERLSLNTAAARIIHYIEAEGVDGSVTLNQSRKAWAAELGLTHEAMYRTLRRLQAGGVLNMDRNRNFSRLSLL